MAEVERQSNELLPVTERAARIAALEAKVEQLERIEETLGGTEERGPRAADCTWRARAEARAA